jgi:hyaluronan synthase
MKGGSRGVRPLRLSFSKTGSDPLVVLAILACGTALAVLAGELHALDAWIGLFRSTAVLRWTVYPFLALSLIALAGSIFRGVLWISYRPDVPDGTRKIDWPQVTVILSALNEERFIEEAVDSIFSNRYPKDRLDVICVDDGSRDGTLAGMKRSREKHGARLTVIHFRRNLGKRKAIGAALKKARGRVIITFDSDSKLDRSAIRNVVLPIVKDAKIGAVAGHVAVLNENENILTRMMSSRYSLSFDYGRAYQSVYGAVFCCPGALAAFRKEVLDEVAGEWLAQTFMKSPCRQGEDRALTTLVLKAGYLVKYQSNALVYTRVPGRLRQIHRMYVRWTRSHIRESIQFAKFMFLPYRLKHRALPVFDFLFLNFLPPLHLLVMVVMIRAATIDPLLVIRTMGVFTIVAFCLSLFCSRSRGGLLALGGAAGAFLTLFTQWWIVPYSALTVKDQSWMTR